MAFSLIFARLCAVCLMILAGIVARHRRYLDDSSTRHLAFISTNLIYPAAIYASLVSNFTLKGILAKWHLPAGAFLVMLCGFAVGALMTYIWNFRNPGERRMFHFQCTINNYVFLPLPLIMAMYGDAGVGLLSISTVGSEIAVWSLGVVAISGGFKLNQLKNLLNMPMAAIAVAILTLAAREWMPWSIPQGSFLRDLGTSLLEAAALFGAGTVGLSMLVAGSRMNELNRNSLFRYLELLLVPTRLLLVPGLSLLLLHFLPFPSESRDILRVVAVMPCSIASVALSDYFAADSSTAAASVLLTHLCSIVTIPFWLSLGT